MHHEHRMSLDERGQTTIALAGVLALALVIGSGLATLAGAMVHRQKAQNAADAVALAGAVDQSAAEELAGWYGERDVFVEHGGDRAHASSGPAHAEAFASVGGATSRPMPALVAIVARAEQLTGESFASVRVVEDRIELNIVDAGRLGLVAGELGLCERLVPHAFIDRIFGLC